MPGVATLLFGRQKKCHKKLGGKKTYSEKFIGPKITIENYTSKANLTIKKFIHKIIDNNNPVDNCVFVHCIRNIDP